jgi:hypothetical protein
MYKILEFLNLKEGMAIHRMQHKTRKRLHHLMVRACGATESASMSAMTQNVTVIILAIFTGRLLLIYAWRDLRLYFI